MAIYSTFFVCRPEELLGGFPGWLPPLPEPVRREIMNPFTKKVQVIETREPEFPASAADAASARPQFKVVSIQGNYADYLEGRIPEFVRGQPHWCGKGLTDVELDPLGEVFGVSGILEAALYSPPSSGAALEQLLPALTAKLGMLHGKALEDAASSWATVMSGPEFTESASGAKLSEGWTTEDAMSILQPLAALAKRSTAGTSMYLLIEA